MPRWGGTLIGMSLTKDKYFLDTNIIIYLFDDRNKNKKKKALELVRHALETGKGIISFQVIQEFCNAALKKFEVPLGIEDCRDFFHSYLMPICTVFPGADIYLKALDVKRDTGYSFYDSLIIAAALQCECEVIYSEDMQSGYNYREMRILNPFE